MIKELLEEYIRENMALKEQINILLSLVDVISSDLDGVKHEWPLEEVLSSPQVTIEIKDGVLHVNP